MPHARHLQIPDYRGSLLLSKPLQAFHMRVHIRILKLVAPCWSTALQNGGIDRKQTGLTDKLNLTYRVVVFQQILEPF